ncbi:IS3 family transposase [Spirosoma validum]|uniref:IS3 family transposase n=1 Tax=Spirosoma validum TaxID=2771355 RepID=UPI001CC2C884|nr:IS3 family transposase [Spirosoma validum]
MSRTAYYRYQRGDSYKPTVEKGNKQQLIEQVFTDHKRRYGSRRIVAELKEKGYEVGRHQVRKLMKLAGLQPIQPRSFVRQRPTVSYDG